MKITINDSQKIFEIIEKFSQLFPYLKVDFFSNPSHSNNTSKRNLVIYTNKTLGECRTVQKKGSILITPYMTVRELEAEFNDIFGLSMQVYRKSGKIWLETTVTDSWTLEEQNKQGQALSS
ncbi:MAG: hypothetical protein SGJ10_05395 [Bacteroidota bacterium]|nr:hypothetical protein [Bacteroidota bacterium]